jgi:hypothetical protein
MSHVESETMTWKPESLTWNFCSTYLLNDFGKRLGKIFNLPVSQFSQCKMEMSASCSTHKQNSMITGLIMLLGATLIPCRVISNF